MTQTEILNFLKEGAFLRLRDDSQVYVWKGPFKALEGSNSSVFSVAYQDFFGSFSALLKASQPVEKMPVGELRKFCLSQAQAASQGLKRGDFIEPQLSQFQQAFQSIQGKIHRGEIEKAVPVVFARSEKQPTKTDLAQMISNALEAYKELYVFGFWKNGMGIIGATPEILFHQKNSHIQSMAFAGTCPKSEAGDRISLLKDPKEMQEHKLVVKDVQERLSKWGHVRLEPTEIVEFPVLLHLRTKMTLESSNVDPLDLVKALHPTPALGVYPRNYGIQWMRELPYQNERNLFGAPITFRLGEEESVSLVAIRNLHWHGGFSYIGSGCGLVSSSEIQREWNELSAKRESVYKVLGL